MDQSKLFCYGCAHSAFQVSFPGAPSGERPCCFCIRNQKRERMIEQMRSEGPIHPAHPVNGFWYDGSPAVKVPMDCYHSLDMKEQIDRWVASARIGHPGDVLIPSDPRPEAP